jgi:hypothetical protein
MALLSLVLLFALLLSTISTTISQSLTQCYVAMVIADQGGGAENDLLSQDEYVTFVSRISTSFNASDGSFDGLPAPLKQNFVNYAESQDDQINIFGVKLGQSDVTEEQEVFLTELCGRTITAINALAIPTIAPVGPTSPTSPRPTRPLNQCFVGMIANDVNPKNDLLDESEYVGFVNFLEPGPFAGLTYSQLPLPLQSNYANLVDSNDDGIDIAGLPSPDPDQYNNLETICDITNAAISIALDIPSDPPSRQYPRLELQSLWLQLPALPLVMTTWGNPPSSQPRPQRKELRRLSFLVLRLPLHLCLPSLLLQTRLPQSRLRQALQDRVKGNQPHYLH